MATPPRVLSNRPDVVDPQRHCIAVVGMGAGGASLFSAILDRVVELGIQDTVCFWLLDARPLSEFGRGLAWSSIQFDGFRANMRLHTIGLKKGLLDKICAAAGVESLDDPKRLTDSFLFHHRTRIGDVLHQDFLENRQKAESYGIPVEAISTHVNEITKGNFGWILHDSNNRMRFAHTVVLALGNVPNYPLNKFRGTPGYFHNPWDWQKYDEIPDGSKVAVIGLGPTAVDAIILLFGRRKATSVHGFSRSGRMQYPRPHNSPHDLVCLSEKRLRDRAEIRADYGQGGMGYEGLLELLTMEFQTAGACPEWSEAKKNSRLPTLEAMYAGLKDAQKESKWYSVMKALDPVTPLIWSFLTPDARRTYKETLREDHTNLSYGMASVQARRITEHLEENRLMVFRIRELKDENGKLQSDIQFDGSKFAIGYHTEEKGRPLTASANFDVVINCTGIGSDIQDTNSPLVRSLVEKGWLQPNPYGGAMVDFTTGQVLGSDEKAIGEIYSLVGSLTYGTHLLTHCLWQVWESSERTAQAITRRIVASAPRVN